MAINLTSEPCIAGGPCCTLDRVSKAGDAPIDGVAGRPGASLQRKAGAVEALSERLADTVEARAGRRPVRSRGEEGQTQRAIQPDVHIRLRRGALQR